MRHSLAAALGALAAAALGVQAALAVGLRVSPGGALIQGVEPGQKAELPMPITVMNDDAEAKVVAFAVLAPGRENMKMPAGYRDIPDLAWVTFTKPEVQVPPKGHAAVKMVLSIPAGKEFHNQHWTIAVAVRTKPVAGQMLTLGLYPRFEIETTPARVRGGLFSRPRPPDGPLAFAPSLETLEAVVPGGRAERIELALWNNTANPFRGQASVVTGAEAAKKERIDLSGGFAWLPDPAWVKLAAAAIECGPKSSTWLPVEVAVPAGKEHHGRAWEAIVLVRGDDGAAAFARLRIKTAP